MSGRLRQLDFLRGMAIILVLLRHQHVTDYTSTMGWMGVDLFFVLSGFLVSGLLFTEYQKHGNLKPGLFLVRRGFKIYPVYYITYVLYLIPIIRLDKLDIKGLLADMTFTQNYLHGWGYAYGASWSLAVEEHFYFALSLAAWCVVAWYFPAIRKQATAKGRRIISTIVVIMISCLLLRYLHNSILPPAKPEYNVTMTHIRIDSLLAGVLISYFFYFRFEHLKEFVAKYRYLLVVLAIAGLSWTPFIEPETSFFGKTTGYTLVYLSFGIILMLFLLSDNINHQLNRVFSKPVVSLVGKIGFSSYSIYVIHTLVINYTNDYARKLGLYDQNVLKFIVVSAISVILGLLITYTIEKYFLAVRDRHFPRRGYVGKKQIW